MIAINELRIGNWVEYKGAALKVESLDIIHERINYPIPIEEKTKLIITGSNVNPIPISKEILEFLSFVKTIDSNHKYQRDFPTEGPFRDMLVARIGEGDFESWVTIRNAVNDWEIGAATSFHQLQNLFFIIYGKEILDQSCHRYGINEGWIITHVSSGS